ncbi:MAG: hypothetical protein M1819_000316 [Sarea resinae]|nr:MAG: hypothetical protein M1819_000316 [Sarea resinae]
MSSLSVVLPGQVLGATTDYLAGPGTHIQGSRLYASILGAVVEAPSPGLPKSSSPDVKQPPIIPAAKLPSLSVVTRAHTDDHAAAAQLVTNVLPEVDAVVLARVMRITPRQATVAILVVGESVCADEFQGLVRVQDVRATEKDKVKIYDSFRPGDIVRAKVISLGDQSNYYLSTANNHLGVIMATSEAGTPMHPISWKEFKDPQTGATESRKVAKPF